MHVRTGSLGVPSSPFAIPACEAADGRMPRLNPRSSLCQAFCSKSPDGALFYHRIGNPSRGDYRRRSPHRGRRPQTASSANRPCGPTPRHKATTWQHPVTCLTPQSKKSLCRAGFLYAKHLYHLAPSLSWQSPIDRNWLCPADRYHSRNIFLPTRSACVKYTVDGGLFSINLGDGLKKFPSASLVT